MMKTAPFLRLLALAVALPIPLAVAGCSSPAETDAQATSTEAASAGTPVQAHGKLSIVGSELRDEHGAVVQLRGMSLFWSQWSGQFWNDGVVGTLAKDFKSSVVRAAMGVESGGYLENPNAEKQRVTTVVDAAVAQGIYVIIDWHDHNATQHTEQSKAFFREMAQRYATTPNVLFELFNEPDNESWPEVKNYAEQVLGEIRGAGASNVVIVGTPTWSQDVDVAANSPITRYSNVAYTLHFYAGSHKQSLRDKATYAINKGLPLFVTEWGTCDASGNGGQDLNESQTWISFLNDHKLSWANWSLFDKNESASALVPGASQQGAWPDSQLTASGRWVKTHILEGAASSPAPAPTPPTPPPSGGNATMAITVSPNINPYWIQVHVDEAGHSIKSVSANVAGRVIALPLQSWGDWAMSPQPPVPGGTRVVFTAVDDQGRSATSTSQPWPG